MNHQKLVVYDIAIPTLTIFAPQTTIPAAKLALLGRHRPGLPGECGPVLDHETHWALLVSLRELQARHRVIRISSDVEPNPPIWPGKSSFWMGNHHFLMGNHHFLMGNDDFVNGKSPNIMDRSTIFNGKTHYFYGHFNSYATHYRRVGCRQEGFSAKSSILIQKSSFKTCTTVKLLLWLSPVTSSRTVFFLPTHPQIGSCSMFAVVCHSLPQFCHSLGWISN